MRMTEPKFAHVLFTNRKFQEFHSNVPVIMHKSLAATWSFLPLHPHTGSQTNYLVLLPPCKGTVKCFSAHCDLFPSKCRCNVNNPNVSKDIQINSTKHYVLMYKCIAVSLGYS